MPKGPHELSHQLVPMFGCSETPRFQKKGFGVEQKSLANLTFLGTSGSVLTAKRACAGILFEGKLLDVGFGVLGNLIRMGDGALEAVNELYITHTHSDHIGDFTGMIWAMALQGRTKQLRVICSETTEASLKRILELQSTPRSGFVKFAINYLRPEEAGVKHLVTIHNPENYAYRFKVENGPEFVYTGDTAKFLDIAKFTLGSDLIIHDATFVAGQESLASLTSHSTAHDAGSIGEAARVDKLVLTHIAPGNEGADRRYISEAGADFDGQIIVAKDNLIVDI